MTADSVRFTPAAGWGSPDASEGQLSRYARQGNWLLSKIGEELGDEFTAEEVMDAFDDLTTKPTEVVHGYRIDVRTAFNNLDERGLIETDDGEVYRISHDGEQILQANDRAEFTWPEERE